jgi:hypothetical protein
MINFLQLDANRERCDKELLISNKARNYDELTLSSSACVPVCALAYRSENLIEYGVIVCAKTAKKLKNVL